MSGEWVSAELLLVRFMRRIRRGRNDQVGLDDDGPRDGQAGGKFWKGTSVLTRKREQLWREKERGEETQKPGRQMHGVDAVIFQWRKTFKAADFKFRGDSPHIYFANGGLWAATEIRQYESSKNRSADQAGAGEYFLLPISPAVPVQPMNSRHGKLHSTRESLKRP